MILKKNQLNIFALALQESFIAFVPYVIVASIAILLPQVLSFVGYGSSEVIVPLQELSKVINRFFPIAVAISISFHFAMRYHISQMNVILLSLLSIITLEYLTSKHADHIPVPYNIDFTIVTIPILATFLISKLAKYFNIDFSDFNAYIYIYRVFKYIYTFIVSYIVIVVSYLIIYQIFNYIIEAMMPLLSMLSDMAMLYIRTILSQLFWFVGIHGPHMVNGVMDTSFLSNDIFLGLSYRKFYQLFVLAGGSGVGLAMIFALLLNRKDKKGIKIAKISLPFSIFNINGILIYGLPIVFNRYLLLPFLLIPLFDIAVAHWFLQWHSVVFVPIKFAWTTPIFVNGWMLSNGDLYVVLFQAGLLFINTLMYIPFIKKYSNITNKSYYIKELEKKLDITTSIQAREGVSVLKKQKNILDTSHKIDDIVKLINQHSLQMYYQPKVNIDNYECVHYEALLRLKRSDGSLVGPYFLIDLEDAGLAPVIDIWVCKEVKEDLTKWKENGYYPEISINLHPDTLSDESAIEQIIDILKGENVEFEILERSLIDNQKSSSILTMLKSNGFKIAIDDFGVGYSSFELMTKFDIDTIKMDKSIIDLIDRPKGFAVCKHIIKLCSDINCRCVAEGVETQEQLDKLHTIGAKYVQGYYFSAAIAPNKLLDYTNSCKSKYHQN
jgi:EAL domain-containing protein (putative c-di-GMP-specific phosphodiesterase class I)/cellobiose-specific phosphotransferase system component IIC